MKGLKEEIPDEEQRYKVIVEECIYFADINPLNIFICKLLLDPLEKYKLNYYEGDILKIPGGVQDEFKLDGFDLVVGNPPYQPPSNNKKGGKSIWPDFVFYALNYWLLADKYLIFVHPALWRKPDNKIGKLMLSKQLHYLSINNAKQGLKVFNAGTRFDYYILQNTNKYTTTKILFEDNTYYDVNISLNNMFIPNFGWNIFNKVFNKINNDTIKVISDSYCHTTRPYVSRNKDDNFKYKLLNSVSNKKGKTFCYSKKPHKNQNKKKVIFSNGGIIVPFYDDGQLGVTEGGLYILVETKIIGEKLIKYLNSKLVKFMIKATKWSNFETTKQLFNYIPDVTLYIDINNENYIFNYFELTEEEIKIIKDNTK
jgi:hypothetical protein